MQHAHILVIGAIMLLAGIFIGHAFAASAFNASLPSHTLQQVETASGSGTSVDNDADGIIDQANTAQGVADGSITSASIAANAVKKNNVDASQICTSSGGAGCPTFTTTLNCTTVSIAMSSGKGTANCAASYKVTGGGAECRGSNLTQSIPSGTGGWSTTCASTLSGQIAYAVCCQSG